MGEWKVSVYKLEHGTWGHPVYDEPLYERVVKLKNIHVSQHTRGSIVESPNTLVVRIYPDDDIRDFEGDPCTLAYFELEHASWDAIIFWPHLRIVGYLPEWKATDEVQEKRHGPAYTPEPDPKWKPRFVAVTINEE